MKRLFALLVLLVFVTLTPAPNPRARVSVSTGKEPEERGTPAPVICRPCLAPPGLSCIMICEPVVP